MASFIAVLLSAICKVGAWRKGNSGYAGIDRLGKMVGFMVGWAEYVQEVQVTWGMCVPRSSEGQP